jgi:hypothetical protein
MKHCPKCQETKSISEFYKNIGRDDGLPGYCAKCVVRAGNESYRALRLKAAEHLGGQADASR